MTTTDWKNELEQQYKALKAGTLERGTAAQMNCAIGKVIALTRLEMSYAKMRADMEKNMPVIPMLEAPKTETPIN